MENLHASSILSALDTKTLYKDKPMMIAEKLNYYFLKFPNDKITVHWKDGSPNIDDHIHGWRFNHITKEVYNLDDLSF